MKTIKRRFRTCLDFNLVVEGGHYVFEMCGCVSRRWDATDPGIMRAIVGRRVGEHQFFKTFFNSSGRGCSYFPIGRTNKWVALIEEVLHSQKKQWRNAVFCVNGKKAGGSIRSHGAQKVAG